jgi:hypothetical protein
MTVNWGVLLARFISAVGSWLDASNLRNRVYQLRDENEIMRIALQDIARMSGDHPVGWLARETLSQIDKG